MSLSINDAITKYGGADEAYRNKLKSTLRDAMGYSNYMSKMNQETGSVAPIGDIKGLSPTGIQNRMSSRFGVQKQNISTLNTITGNIDSTAGSLADAQAAREKAAASAANNKFGYANGVMFDPQSPLEQRISDYMKNPYNADGSVKSLQQFESETNAYYHSPDMMATSDKNVDANGSPIPYAVKNPDEVKKAIEARVPKDFIGNEQLYSAMSMGYSRKQAQDPSTSGAVRDAMQTDTKEIVDPSTGQKTTEVLPKFTTADIQNKYPDLTDVEVKGIMKPVEQKAMADDVSKWVGKNKDSLSGLLLDPNTKQPVATGWMNVIQSDEYKALSEDLSHEYPNFTAGEISNVIYNMVKGM